MKLAVQPLFQLVLFFLFILFFFLVSLSFFLQCRSSWFSCKDGVEGGRE